ncbi:MAG: HEPN domain-containing protein [Candidatus Helarchaeota archaeon]
MTREDIENWYKEGKNDFENAKKMSSIGIYNAATFYCEQAIQKLLKASWIQIKKMYPPKTHNIARLGNQLNAPQEIISLLKRIGPFYMISRYPDAVNGIPSEMIDKNIAEEIIRMTEEVINWIEQII